MTNHNKPAALISVSDQSGLPELAKALVAAGYELLATSGTRKFLEQQKIPSNSVEDYTGSPEILDGRVKTLHPKIHAGLLAKRNNPKHMTELQGCGAAQIDIAVINLYPFIEKQKEREAGANIDLVEYIDVGGPTMIRAAAKNHAFVLPIIDPSDYPEIIDQLKLNDSSERFPIAFRRRLAGKVFKHLSAYDGCVAQFLLDSEQSKEELPESVALKASNRVPLRYGENSHQKAALYKEASILNSSSPLEWIQHGGKELSYNNILDLDAGIALLRDTVKIAHPVAAILKHLNPCGVAQGETPLQALQLAKDATLEVTSAELLY